MNQKILKSKDELPIELREFHGDETNPYYNLPRVTVNKDNLILIIKHFLRDDNSRCLEVVKNIIDKHQHLDFLTLLQKINSCFYTDETITEALLFDNLPALKGEDSCFNAKFRMQLSFTG